MAVHRTSIRFALVATVIACAGIAGLHAFAEAGDAPPLPAAKDGHRVLRNNMPAGYVPPTEPETYTGHPGAGEFAVVTREDKLTFFPCEQCHSQLPLNTQPRKLMSPHPAALKHGDGRFWCLDCHNGEYRNVLKTFTGETVSFNEANRICGQCHYAPEKDWTFGGHGKRVANWQGERTIYSCTHCHNPHDPSVKPRAPESPPPVRKGLEPMPDVEAHHAAGLERLLEEHDDDETSE